jgi:glycine cleavage system transcriptional repressor
MSENLMQYVISAVGPDRPGLVGELTGHLHAAGANLLDSRMVNLRGQFALVLLMECPQSVAAVVSQSLPAAAEEMGLRLSLSPHALPKGAEGAHGIPMRLKTYSLDQPGIVHRVTHLLQSHGVNIEELTTRQESAAFAGTPLFLMEMRMIVPPAVAVRKLRAELESLCDGLNCDVDLEPA